MWLGVPVISRSASSRGSRGGEGSASYCARTSSNGWGTVIMTLVHATNSPTMKGYFGIGVEGISKAVNVGTLFRTAHAFGASFVFTVRAQYNRREGGQADTSDTPRSVPTHHFAGLEDFRLPLGCRLVGIEITADAIELPSFRHPRQAAYILGSEREGLSADLQSRCDFVVKIPTRFSVN